MKFIKFVIKSTQKIFNLCNKIKKIKLNRNKI